MADLFERINDVLGNSVELYYVNDAWTVRVVEDGVVAITTYSSETEATEYAEAEVQRLGISKIIRF